MINESVQETLIELTRKANAIPIECVETLKPLMAKYKLLIFGLSLAACVVGVVVGVLVRRLEDRKERGGDK